MLQSRDDDGDDHGQRRPTKCFIGNVTPPPPVTAACYYFSLTVTREREVHSLEIITFEMFNFSALAATRSESNFFIPLDGKMDHYSAGF